MSLHRLPLAAIGLAAALALNAQTRAPMGGGPAHLGTGACVSPERAAALVPELRARADAWIAGHPDAFAALRQGTRGGGHPTFSLPVRAKAGFDDYGFHVVNYFVDQDLSPFSLEDWACGTRTYDWAFGNHEGTDYVLWPYPWKRMDEGVMEIVAGAPGVILLKEDGNYDRNCVLTGIYDWNAIYVLHADSSIAWYLHFQDGSLTAKGVGDAVAEGEFLGTAGSSGSSSVPHLHFQVYDAGDELVDPYAGACNALNADTWWQEQPDYWEPAINRISTHYGVPGEDCPDPETTREQAAFDPGDSVFLVLWYRDLRNGALTELEVEAPDGSLRDAWTFTSPWDDYPAAWAYWYLLTGPSDPLGAYTFRATFGGATYERVFWLGDMPSGLPAEGPAADATLFPNPTVEAATLRFRAPAGTALRATVHDAAGRERWRREAFARTGEDAWTLPALPPGAYAVRWTAGASAGVRRLLVTR
jgi:hypothetical protein